MSEEEAEERQIEKINITFPVAVEWKIEEEKIPFNSANQDISSKSYNVPGFPWFTYNVSFETKLEINKFFIKFYRNGLNEDQCEWESNLCLTINNWEPKKVSQKFNEEILLLYEGSIVELNFSKNGVSDPIILRFNGTITVHEISKVIDHFESISSDFQELKEPKDFVIEAENQKIQVHKKVLQKYSPVFSGMFENGWKEASEGRVVIPEFPLKTVKKAIDMCYGEWIWSDMDNLELILLYRFADKYDMDEIKQTIKKLIMLTPNNICEYANLFHAENCPIFVSHCIDRLIVYFQFSYPVKDLENLNNDIKNQFFTQASVSDSMKKEFNPDYYKNLNDEEEKEALPFL